MLTSRCHIQNKPCYLSKNEQFPLMDILMPKNLKIPKMFNVFRNFLIGQNVLLLHIYMRGPSLYLLYTLKTENYMATYSN